MSDMDVDRHMNQNAETAVPSSQQEEEAVKKKDGGILPKKTTSHIRGWALGKVSLSAHTKLFRAKTLGELAHKPKESLEALRPKLQPTPHLQVHSRRTAYAHSDSKEGGSATSEDT
uniref:Uncharacterized protein n=1 Tax=Musa acuminata subsp. malaccensis TaxID=214687 RepID=A0A804I1G0_MUSAM